MVPADPVVGFEDEELVVAVQAMGRDEARDPGPDDRDPHFAASLTRAGTGRSSRTMPSHESATRT